MLVLVLNALLPLVAQAAVVKSEAVSWQEVCTTTGMVKVQSPLADQANAAQQHDKGGAALDMGKHCPLCLLHGGAIDVPPLVSVFFVPLERTGFPPAFYQASATSAVWLSAQSRAPPVLS